MKKVVQSVPLCPEFLFLIRTEFSDSTTSRRELPSAISNALAQTLGLTFVLWTGEDFAASGVRVLFFRSLVTRSAANSAAFWTVSGCRVTRFLMGQAYRFLPTGAESTDTKAPQRTGQGGCRSPLGWLLEEPRQGAGGNPPSGLWPTLPIRARGCKPSERDVWHSPEDSNLASRNQNPASCH